MATTKKPAAKQPAPKIDPALCRGGQGRYMSPKTSKACTNPRHPGRQLCDSCEAVYKAAKKGAKAKVAPAPKVTAKKPTRGKVVPLRADAAPLADDDPMTRELAAVKRMKEVAFVADE